VKPLVPALSCALVLGCAPEVRLAPSPPSPSNDTASASPSFSAWEAARIDELAAVDRRLALRMRREPTEVDLFSFDARSLRLEAVARRVASPPRGSERDSKEVEILSRLIAEERARVDEERQLPRSGSELVRGVVATWTTPSSVKDLREYDAWVSSKIDEVLASLAPAASAGSLRSVEITELEDALDPLERLAEPSGYPGTQGTIARLRVALGTSRAAASKGMGWEALHQRLLLHLGVGESESVLREELAQTEGRLRAEAGAALTAAGEADARLARRSSEALVLAEGGCQGQGGASPVRGFAPPPDRSFVCSALHQMADARPEADVRTLLALHDAVTVATWAFAIHVDDVDPVEAPHGRSLLSDVPPERVGRLVRLAAVRPLACIAVARMATILEAKEGDERRARATRWIAYGDAPLDIVARDVR